MALQHFLRGGGNGCSKPKRQVHPDLVDTADLHDFFSSFNYYANLIDSKAFVAANQYEQKEIKIAIQWFIYQEENIYKLNKNIELVKKSYDLILDGVRKLLKSCLVYIRTDQFICFYLLQITASLSKVIFSFYLNSNRKNNENKMDSQIKNEFLNISDELYNLIQIENNYLIQNQMEFFLSITKTSFQLAPSNKMMKYGIFFSVIQMTPDTNLLESLLSGACQLLEKLNTTLNQKKKQYEMYYCIEMLQWEVIDYLKKDKQKCLEEILSQIEMIYDKLVKQLERSLLLDLNDMENNNLQSSNKQIKICFGLQKKSIFKLTTTIRKFDLVGIQLKKNSTISGFQ